MTHSEREDPLEDQDVAVVERRLSTNVQPCVLGLGGPSCSDLNIHSRLVC